MATKLVFLNCPFDSSYGGILNAVVFCVMDAGFRPCCALERVDSIEVRLDKILDMISVCDYGIHDVSYVHVDPETHLPRFNMPFELGVFIGCKKFGGPEHTSKRTIVFDSVPDRYRKSISDIAGQDVLFHRGEPKEVVRQVRDWLRAASGEHIPGGADIWGRYERFLNDLPGICEALRVRPDQLTYPDFTYCANIWLKKNPGI